MCKKATSATAATTTPSCTALCRASCLGGHRPCVPCRDGRAPGRLRPSSRTMPGHDEREQATSLHHNLRLFGHREPVVAFPGERKRAACRGGGEESHERVGGDRREEQRGEDLF